MISTRILVEPYRQSVGQKQFDSGVDLSVHDDEGNRLGGKRASIKFAHDRIRATDSGANGGEDNLSGVQTISKKRYLNPYSRQRFFNELLKVLIKAKI